MSGASDEDLLEQWAFLDRMTQRQAAQLRSGVQDEEDEGAVAAPAAPAAAELEPFRARIAELERTVAELNDRLAQQTAALDASGRRHAAELTDQRTELGTVRDQLTAETARAAALQRERDAFVAQLADAGIKVNELRTELAAARAAAEQARAATAATTARRRWWQR